MARVKTCNSANLFLDTNVILSYANNDMGSQGADIEVILQQAAARKRSIWISDIILAELRPSLLKSTRFSSISELVSFIRRLTNPVSATPNIMMRTARLRDIQWRRPGAKPEEKNRVMSLGDALHMASALFVKEAQGITDLQFLTFDNGKTNSTGEKSLSLLELEKYTEGLSSNDDVMACIRLARAQPVLSQRTLAL